MLRREENAGVARALQIRKGSVDVERESMEFDVVIVGAGPSGLSTVIAKVYRACSERHGDNEMRSGHPSPPDPCCTKTALAFAFIALVGYHVVAGAQQVGGAVNPSVPEVVPAAERKLRLDYSVTPIALRIVLPPADTATKRSAAGTNRSRPLQIGFHRAMPDKFQGDLSPRLDWVDMGDGSIVAALSVTSPEASAMRMGIRAELPEGGEIRFFDGQTDQGHDDPGFPVIGWDDLRLKDERPTIPPPPVVKGGATGTQGAPPSREALPALSLTLKGGSNPEILWSPVVEGDTSGWRSRCLRWKHGPPSHSVSRRSLTSMLRWGHPGTSRAGSTVLLTLTSSAPRRVFRGLRQTRWHPSSSKTTSALFSAPVRC